MADKIQKKQDTVRVENPLKKAKVVPLKVKTKADVEKEKDKSSEKRKK